MSVERFQSLPKKTQPTLHSSKHTVTASHRPPSQRSPNCPETSEFRLPKHDKSR